MSKYCSLHLQIIALVFNVSFSGLQDMNNVDFLEFIEDIGKQGYEQNALGGTTCCEQQSEFLLNGILSILSIALSTLC